MNDMPGKCLLCIEKPFTFFDMRERGFKDTIFAAFSLADGNLRMYITHNLISDYIEDDWVGTHTYEVVSNDDGKTWSDPVLVRLPRVKNLEKESLHLNLHGPTAAGTELCFGYHQKLDQAEGTVHHDMSLRDYMMLLGRREKGQAAHTFRECPPGTFMGEQFMEGGLQLPSGRLVFTIWGILTRGENWRSGVLLSDDDGRNWRFRTVAYEPDLAIRDKPAMPAGFNEQTLFHTQSGRIVSIIRGREKLGRGVPGGGDRDTWFFRSESRDDGETWSPYEATNLPGTGATFGQGLTLPDGSLLIGCRIPYSREYYDLPEKDLYGLNLARSFDEGRTWKPEFIIQRDHEGNPFNNHYCAMNGRFRKISDHEYLYYFGFFGHDFKPKLQRLLGLKLKIR
jgi:hypothetical protein